MAWSLEQVLGLAPDAAAAHAGRGLAAARHWLRLGLAEQALWGECQGSAKEPYRTAIDLDGPAFRCSCPSRKVPCKHALGLFLLYTGETGALPDGGEVPGWVATWLTARRARTAPSSEPRPAPDAARATAGRRRREGRIGAGLDELERWLEDVVRDGLAELPSRPRSSFERMAARLVDAQAPGVARLVRELSWLPQSGERWPERMLIALGRLQLVVEAWRRLETLDESVQAELRALLGISESREDVLARPAVHDRWSVLGRRVVQEERMRIQRTWLHGQGSQRWALLLEFALGGQRFEQQFVAGTSFEADLCFYAGSLPLRAQVAHAPSGVRPAAVAGRSVADELLHYAEALAANPWLERWPMALGDVVPRSTRDGWWLVDAEGQQLPVVGPHGWHLLALAGGHPVEIVGEWDGFGLYPLAVWAEGVLVPLRAAAA